MNYDRTFDPDEPRPTNYQLALRRPTSGRRRPSLLEGYFKGKMGAFWGSAAFERRWAVAV